MYTHTCSVLPVTEKKETGVILLNGELLSTQLQLRRKAALLCKCRLFTHQDNLLFTAIFIFRF